MPLSPSPHTLQCQLRVKVLLQHIHLLGISHLNLLLLQAVLPDRCVGCDAVFAEVDQDVHAVLIHRLALVQVVVVVVADDLLHGAGRAGLELLGFVGLAGGLQSLENGFAVF